MSSKHDAVRRNCSQHAYWLAAQDLLVVVPSMSFNREELEKVKGVDLYELRLTYHFLLLAKFPSLHVAFVTSSACSMRFPLAAPTQYFDFY